MTKLVLKVKGMHCASCSILIDKLIGKQAGVVSITTNYGSEKTAVEFDETKISIKKIDELVYGWTPSRWNTQTPSLYYAVYKTSAGVRGRRDFILENSAS